MVKESNKIAFVSTVSNVKLYKKSSQYYPPFIRRYRIDGRKGMYGFESFVFMVDSLKETDIEWLVMIDEDAILLDYERLYDLILYMDHKNFLICGMQDGGVINVRKQSPFAINTYFSVINFKEFKQIWDLSEIKNNQYIKQDEFSLFKDHLKTEYDVDSLFEKYYCIYFWILRKGYKILYLNAENPIVEDQITNILYNHLNDPILYHTWYGRLYGKNKSHTKRINAVIEKCRSKYKKSKQPKPIILINKEFKHRVKKNIIFKLIERVMRKINT